MAGRLASLLQPKPDRRLLILLILLAILIAAVLGTAVFLRLQPTGEPAGAAADLDAAAAAYTAAIERAPSLADGYRGLSLLYQAAGRQADAVAVWERAAKANPGQTWPLLGLGGAYAEAGDLLAAREATYRAVALDPQDSAANAALAALADAFAKQQAIKEFLLAQTPAAAPDLLASGFTLLRQPLANGWTFLGYYGDLAALAAGGEASLWTFWQAPAADTIPTVNAANAGADAAWQQVAPGIWGRQAAAVNLLQNGSFEGPLTQSGPSGFSDELFFADAVTRQVRRLLRGDQFTAVAALTNDADNPSSSLVSGSQPLPPDAVLLAAADVLSEGGSPGLAWSWPGAALPQNWPLQGSAQTEEESEEWQRLVAVAVPPPGAQAAQLQLLNTASSGGVYFDNAVLAPITAPAPLWPVVAGSGAAGAAAAPAIARRSAVQQLTERFTAQMDSYAAWPSIVQDLTWQAGLAAIGPLTRVDQTLSNGWRLEGYSTDESRLARSERTPLVLYWQGPAGIETEPGARSAADGWIDAGEGRWLQFLPSAANSLTNGDFEGSLAVWSERVFAAPAATRQLAVTTRGAYSTTAGVLTNTLVFSSTNFATAFQPVEADQLFLQAGWLRSDGARGYMGHQWNGDLDPLQQPFDGYIVADDEDNTWRHFAGVAEPLAGADQVRVLLLNYEAEGAAYFDDIIFVPIDAPAPLAGTTLSDNAAGSAAGQSDARALLAEYAANPAVTADERWLGAVAAAGPARLLDQGMEDGWSFVGFTADEEALTAGAAAPIFYFWQGPAGETPGSAQDGWYTIGSGMWLAIERTDNLLLGDGRLFAPASSTASTAPPVEVDGRLFYLLAGRLRGAAGGGLGLAWLDAGGILTPPQKIASTVNDREWEAVAGLLTSPSSAAAAQVVLTGSAASGLAAGGPAEAEQLLLLPVNPPAPLAPAVGAQPLTRLHIKV